MQISKNIIIDRLKEMVIEEGGSSFDDVWLYLKQVFKITENNDSELIKARSEQLNYEIMHNHGQIPDLCTSTLTDKEKFDYIRVMAVIVHD